MDVHDLTAAYALDALDGDEAEAYERHLGQCEECRQQLAELNETSAALAFGAVAPAPPTRLRASILDAAAAGSYYLDVSGAEPNSHASTYPRIEQRLRASRPRATVYFHVVRQAATARVAIEYWFLYLYNDFYDKHEADWEGVTVFLQGTSPLGVSYSAHQGRRWSRWASQSAQNGTHPIVYAAYGSHANYSARGRYSIKVCWTLHGQRHCAVTPKADVASGTGAKLAPSGYDLQQLGGRPYTGDWGSGNYILGIGRTSDHVTDPRRRSEYANPFSIVPG